MKLRFASSPEIQGGLLGLFLVLVSCSPSYRVGTPAIGYREVDSTFAADPAAEAAIAPYKTQLDARMNERLAVCETELTKSYPEGLLNNFVADLMLSYGRETLDPSLDFSLINNGGLRIPLPPGEITLRHVYELMPFDNTVVVLTLAPEQMQEMLNQVAKGSEASFGGLRLTIENGTWRNVTIGGSPYDPSRSYRLITIDYLAQGGSNMTFLKTRTHYQDTGTYMRDFLAAYLRMEQQAGRTIRAQLDGRFQILGTTNE